MMSSSSLCIGEPCRHLPQVAGFFISYKAAWKRHE